uniref:Uncharacterized protein n=1 Tax=Mucochytrium quahogii TaxID=96639 RepID=A0A7S2SBQ6_9STRA|mmetsp:Transcript_3608/g.7885  ORF Transcript_3608/g.7885 Transcript_3608/m.7885 type:complete len:128 (+) Transcript_3608:1027-1410(+)
MEKDIDIHMHEDAFKTLEIELANGEFKDAMKCGNTPLQVTEDIEDFPIMLIDPLWSWTLKSAGARYIIVYHKYYEMKRKAIQYMTESYEMDIVWDDARYPYSRTRTNTRISTKGLRFTWFRNVVMTT